MSRRGGGARRRPARAGLVRLGVAAVLIAGLLVAVLARPGAAGAAAGELVGVPDVGSPASNFLGASPLEAPGEVWATATGGSHQTFARYTTAGGWEKIAPPTVPGGGSVEFTGGANVGRATADGGVVAAATLVEPESEEQGLVVRPPGGAAAAAPPGAALHEGEQLFEGSSVELAAVEEPGAVGAYVAPATTHPEAILAFKGGAWHREPICFGLETAPECAAPPSSLRVVGIDASGGQAWFMARAGSEADGLELFHREPTGGSEGTPAWRQVPLGPAGSLGARFAGATLELQPLGEAQVKPRTVGQVVSATETGLWLDAQIAVGGRTYEATLFYQDAAAEVTASWCDVPEGGAVCTFPLGAELPAAAGRSFAWPTPGPYGTRVVTGVGEGAILELEGTAFARATVGGGSSGSNQGAAFASPEEGWLGGEVPIRVTRNPEAGGLQSWPVPFRRPLLAIAGQPGATPGGTGAEALAVGDEGEIARYQPGIGWQPEFLLNGSGKRTRPTLRAVAWPEPERAYAVGDHAAMWVWQKATGLWEPDPGEPPNLALANFTGIAFSPLRPSRGYAVGKQGLLLGYGRGWTREPLPAGVPAEANFTSIAFAGEEALATWKMPIRSPGGLAVYEGGVIADSGSGWHVAEAAQAALAGEVPQRVAGLPDGSAAIVAQEGRGTTEATAIERYQGGAWVPTPVPVPGYPVALGAVEEAGTVRALVSIDPGQASEDLGVDEEQVFDQPAPGQAPLFTDAYPLPGGGDLIRQTATGWRDEQHEDFPLPAQSEAQTAYDMPRRPDPVLALLVEPAGGQGWAVGGETGSRVLFEGTAVQTAGVERYGAGATAPPNTGASTLPTPPGTASFALGANAQCAGPCADLGGTGIGPQRWMQAALARAGEVSGVRAFLYAGAGVAPGAEGKPSLAGSISDQAFAREESAYARRLLGAGPPVFAAGAESDLDASGSTATFLAAFAGFGQPFGRSAPAAGITPVSATAPGRSYYSFLSAGTGGTVKVIVLDYTAPTLADEQRCWLAQELAAAGAASTPALVVGWRDLTGNAPNAAADGAQVAAILTGTGTPVGCEVPAPAAASAYLFDFPEQNRSLILSAGGRSIPAYGTGTLGYVTPPRATETDFVGAGGFDLVSVNVASRDATTNIAPVSVQLTPNLGSLALDATDGTLIRRSQPALFEALARRPLGGSRCTGSAAPATCERASPDPYVQIPPQCVGTRCATATFPAYSFTSSEPDIADFVEADPGSVNRRSVLLVGGKPVADAQSGLLCAFNAGTTTVTVSSGGLSYSQTVRVLGGTAQRPCGTTPLKNQPTTQASVEAPPPPPVEPAPQGGTQPSEPPPPPPPPNPVSPSQPLPTPTAATPIPTPVPAQATHPPPVPAPPYVLPLPAPAAAPVVTIVPPPPLPAVQPTPPTGTSPVTEPQVSPEDEEDEEVAYEDAQSMTARQGRTERELLPATLRTATEGSGGPPVGVAAIVLLAVVGAGLGLAVGTRDRDARRRRRVAYAGRGFGPAEPRSRVARYEHRPPRREA